MTSSARGDSASRAVNESTRGVVILGMGRSGTSAVTRMFHRSGYFLGEESELMAADEANPTGYFENWTVYRVNEEVLSHVEGSWFDAPPDAEQLALDRERTRPLRETLERLLSCAGASPLALKDPRIGILMPVWWPLLEGVLHPVLVVRHPLEIAVSLERRDGTAIPVALAMWELHVTRVLDHLDGRRVTVVPYRRVLVEDGLAAELVTAASTELRPELRDAVDPAQARTALEPALRRNRVEGDGPAWLSGSQKRLWELLESLSPGTTSIETPKWARDVEETVVALTRYETSRQRAFFGMGARIEQASADLRERDRLVRERDATIDKQRCELEDRERALATHADQLDALAETAFGLEEQLEEVRRRCRSAEERLQTAEHWLTVMKRSLSWRLTAPLRSVKRSLRPVRSLLARRG